MGYGIDKGWLRLGAQTDDPHLQPWVVRNVSARLPGRAAALVAGRKQRQVSRDEVVSLISDAYHQGGRQVRFPATKRSPCWSFAS